MRFEALNTVKSGRQKVALKNCYSLEPINSIMMVLSGLKVRNQTFFGSFQIAGEIFGFAFFKFA